MNVSLTPALEKYVRARVKSGRYGSASEVMRDAIRALQQHEKDKAARLKQLRATLARSRAQADAGQYRPIEDAVADIRASLRARPRRRRAA